MEAYAYSKFRIAEKDFNYYRMLANTPNLFSGTFSYVVKKDFAEFRMKFWEFVINNF